MSHIQKLNRSMIEQALKAANLKYLTDSEGDFRVEFEYSEKRGGQLDIWLIVEGSDDSLYNIRGFTPNRVSREDWGKAVKACNTWNKEKRWPKTFLNVQDMENDQTAQILTEMQFSLAAGLHQELLNELTHATIAGMFVFFEYVHQEYNL